MMTVKRDLQALIDRYVTAYRAGDAAGCAAVFTLDAEMFSPYGPQSRGRAAIEATHREWVAVGGEAKQLTVTDAGHSGDLGWCLAHFDEGATGSGTSLNVVERQPDGNWLIRLCSLNAAH